MELKFDHIIHYINQLNQFEFPGKLLKLHNGETSSIWYV